MDINNINNLLKQGKTVKEIREILGISEKIFQRKIRELGYKYNQKEKQYKHNINDDKSMTNESSVLRETKNDISSDIVLCNDKGMTIDMQEDLKNNIISLANDYSKIQEVLKWFENKIDDKDMTEIIEVINEGIKINLPEAEIIRTTIRINGCTWNRFKEFSNNHKEFNQQDLMAQALEEYMDKYK